MSNMRLTVLVDNNTYIDQYYVGEPAASYLVEADGKIILFDTGYSDCVVKNAEKMHIDLNKVDMIVCSHGHNDHSGGLEYLDIGKKSLIVHPDFFVYRFFDDLSVGITMPEEEIRKKYDVKTSKEPLWLSENVCFLGQIPEIVDGRDSVGTLRDGHADFVRDDTAIVVRLPEGLFVISGCSHAGIHNIIEYAKRVCEDERVIGVIGGFHLFELNERSRKVIGYLKDNVCGDVYPCHCTSLKVKAEMMKHMPVIEVGIGLVIER